MYRHLSILDIVEVTPKLVQQEKATTVIPASKRGSITSVHSQVSRVKRDELVWVMLKGLPIHYKS